MAQENEAPKLPSFKTTNKKEEEKGAVPSFLKGFSRSATPMPKARAGLPAVNLVDRLKSLRKKDLAFIAAGLSTLVMAPVAEHFVMSPEDQSGQLQGGFSRNGAFGDAGSIYDPGTGSMSPGGLIGQGSDVITPLNVRDPSALIMGPGMVQKPSASVDAAAPPKADSGWKDALAAAQKGATAATKAAKLPTPHPKMQGALRGGVGGGGGGSGASFTLPPINANNVPNRAGDSNALTRSQAAPGYKGAASRSTAPGGGAESLKGAGSRQGDLMNKGGSAAGALDQAAREAIPGGYGGAGAGGPSGGEADKGPGGSNAKDSKSLGESLEFLRRKMEMEKEMDLKWKKKAWKEFERGKMIEETLIKSAIENLLGKGLFEPMGGAIGDAFKSLTGGPQGMSCKNKNGDVVQLSMAEWGKWGKEASQKGDLQGCKPWPGSSPTGGGGTGNPSDQAPGDVGPIGGGGGQQPQPGTGRKSAYARFSEAQGGAKGWSGEVGKLGSAKSQVAAAKTRACLGTDAPYKKICAQMGAAQGKLDASEATFKEATAKNEAAQKLIGGANKTMDEALKEYASQWLVKEKAVSGSAKSALGAYKTDAPAEFGFQAAQGAFEGMKGGAQEVDSWQSKEEQLQKEAAQKLEESKATLEQGVQAVNKALGEGTITSEVTKVKSIVATLPEQAANKQEYVKALEAAQQAVLDSGGSGKSGLSATGGAMLASKAALEEALVVDRASLEGSDKAAGGRNFAGNGKGTDKSVVKAAENANKAVEALKTGFPNIADPVCAAANGQGAACINPTLKEAADNAIKAANQKVEAADNAFKTIEQLNEKARQALGDSKKQFEALFEPMGGAIVNAVTTHH